MDALEMPSALVTAVLEYLDVEITSLATWTRLVWSAFF
jgi:hypothetical protein